MTTRKINASLVLFIENRIFPALFFGFSLKHIYTLYQNAGRISERLQSGIPDMALFIFLSDILIMIVLVFFNSLIAYALLTTRNLHKEPEGFLELFIPLIATFWFLTYNIIPYLPSGINFLVIPKALLPASISVGSIFALIGLTVASLAIFHLRASFGVFVEVRDIVTQGLYRYVRHPIYLGHIMANIGFFFITPRVYALLLSATLLILTVFRAQLEEKKLAKNSEAYRRYIKTIPFIIPYKKKQMP